MLTDQSTEGPLGLVDLESSYSKLHQDYVLKGNDVMVKIDMIRDAITSRTGC